MKCSIVLHFIWVFTACSITHLGVSSLRKVKTSQSIVVVKFYKFHILICLMFLQLWIGVATSRRFLFPNDVRLSLCSFSGRQQQLKYKIYVKCYLNSVIFIYTKAVSFTTLVNVYVDLLVFTHIVDTS